MFSDWQISTLDKAPLEIIDGDRGANYPKQNEFSLIGHCLFLNAGNVTSSGFDFSDCVFINAEKDASLRKGRLERYDVVLTTRGTVGNAAYYDDSVQFERIRINSGMVILRAHSPDLDPRYLYYFVRSALFRDQVMGLRTGSAQPQLPIRDIFRIRIPLPSCDEQRAIADILGALDGKIELNRRMNETLEATARAIFKSWFVDFDPVRAKMDGRWHKGESLPGLPAHLYNLFPDRLLDTELGEIPEGWALKPFSDMVEVIGGGTPKTSVAEYWGGNIPWFSVVDAPNSSDVWVIDTEKMITQDGLENSSARMLPERTTIITARGTVGRVALIGVPMAMNQSCYGLRSKLGKQGFYSYFVVQQLISHLQQRAHGSVFSTITRATFNCINVLFPSEALVEAFEVKIGVSLERIRSNLLESRIAARLRDELLPRLILGEVSVLSQQ